MKRWPRYQKRRALRRGTGIVGFVIPRRECRARDSSRGLISRLTFSYRGGRPMKRKVLLLLVTATLAFAAPALADQFLLGFNGFGYHIATPGSTHYLDVGRQYFRVGFVSRV